MIKLLYNNLVNEMNILADYEDRQLSYPKPIYDKQFSERFHAIWLLSSCDSSSHNNLRLRQFAGQWKI